MSKKLELTHVGSSFTVNQTELSDNGTTFKIVDRSSNDRITIDDAITSVLSPDGSTAIDVDNDLVEFKGPFIAYRITTTQRDALTPVNGMIIYNTTTNAFNFYENGAWVTK